MKAASAIARHPLESIATIQYGFTAKASLEPVGPKFLRITDIQAGVVDWSTVPFCKVTADARERFGLARGEIVFARTGATTGKSYLISDDVDAVFASYLIRVKPSDESVCPQYLAYYFQTTEYWEEIEAGTEGAAQGGFNASKLGRLNVPIPPLEEQKRIVAVLDQAFVALDRARAHAEANLADADTLFVRLAYDNLSKIAETGNIAQVGKIADHCLGKMLDKNKNRGTLRPYLRNINVRWFEVDTSDVLEMRIEDRELDRYEVRKGDLLICEGGYPGRAAIYDVDEPTYFQKALHRVRFGDESLARVLMYWLFVDDKLGKLKDRFSGTGISHFTGKALASYPMPVSDPPTNARVVNDIDRHLVWTSHLVSSYQQKLADLATLRQSLLQKAFAGELT